MGVLGLSRWSTETQRLISNEITLPVPKGSGDGFVDGEVAQIQADGDWLVIDAWAWIHYLWHSMNENVYQGGSLVRFRMLIMRWIDTMRDAGFQLVVVFDGPRLHQKLASTLGRVQQSVRLNAKLMRAGTKLRKDPEFEHGRLLPPGLVACVQSVLDQRGVESRMGSEEVDYAIAQLANERAGYVLSRDSDFLILCANAPQCKGYVALHSLEFIAKEKEGAAEPEPEPEEDDGFTQVGAKGRVVKPAASMSHLPHLLRTPVLPGDAARLEQTAVRFRCYSSYKVAQQLKLPLALLPVFAGLVGTEKRPMEQAELYNTVFHGVQNRMPVLASLLEEQYQAAAGDGNGAAKSALAAGAAGQEGEPSEGQLTEEELNDPVIRLLAATFDSIVAYGQKRRGTHLPVSQQQRSSIVRGMNQAVLAYTPSEGEDALSKFMEPTESTALQRFQDAYWRRQFDQLLASVLLERIYIARVFLEEPDEPSAQRNVVRSLRLYVWSVLLDVWLEVHPDPEPEPAEGQETQEGGDQGDAEGGAEGAEGDAEGAEGDAEGGAEGAEGDAGDAGDAGAEGDAGDATLNASMENTHLDGQDEIEQPEEEDSTPSLATVTEYTRTEYSLRKDEVHVPALGELLPLAAERTGIELPDTLGELVEQHEEVRDAREDDTAPVLSKLHAAPVLPEETRLELWLYAHHSADEAVRALPQEVWPVAAALRYAVVENHERLGVHRTRHNWTAAELSAAVYAACVSRRVFHEATPAEMQAIAEAYPSGSPSNRSITQSTMLSFVLETSALLTQVLVLSDKFPHAHALFEPPLFHAQLAATLEERAPSEAPAWARFEDGELHDRILGAVMHGNEGRIGRPRAKGSANQPKKSEPRQRRHLGLLEETML